jgi:hypothetical protein
MARTHVLLTVLLALCASARGQLVASSDYSFYGGGEGAYSNLTWSVRLSSECKPGALIRCYQAHVTGVMSLDKFRVMQLPQGGTNWTPVCRARSDMFGFLDVFRARRWRVRNASALKVPAQPERLSLVTREGIVAEVPLATPSVRSISGPLLNTGMDPLASGTVVLSVQGDTLQFRLFLTGVSARYTLWINDVSCATYETSDGLVEVGNYPEGAPAFDDVKRFAITDDHGVEVLAAQLY